MTNLHCHAYQKSCKQLQYVAYVQCDCTCVVGSSIKLFNDFIHSQLWSLLLVLRMKNISPQHTCPIANNIMYYIVLSQLCSICIWNVIDMLSNQL